MMIEGVESLAQYDSTDVQQYDSKSVHLQFGKSLLP